jgi:hypothetical protein
VGVAQVVDPDANSGIRCSEGRQPDMVAEPPAGDAPIRIDGPRSSGRVRSAGASIRPVDGKCSPAVSAPALACRVGAERPVPVPATGVIRLGQPEPFRVRDDPEPWRGLTDARHGEEQIIRLQTVPLGMRGELGNDMRAELDTAVLLSFRVVPDQKLSPVRMELRVELDRLPRIVGVLLLGKGAGNAGLPASITVIGGVALPPRSGLSASATIPRRSLPSRSFDRSLTANQVSGPGISCHSITLEIGC